MEFLSSSAADGHNAMEDFEGVLGDTFDVENDEEEDNNDREEEEEENPNHPPLPLALPSSCFHRQPRSLPAHQTVGL